MRLGVIRFDPDGFAKRRLGSREIAAFQKQSTQTVVRFRQIRIDLDGLLKCGGRLRT